MQRQAGGIGGEIIEGQVEDLDFTGLQLDLDTLTCEIIGALAIDLDGRKGRRHLFDQADKLGQGGFYCFLCRARIGFGDGPAFSIVTVRRFTEGNREAVNLVGFHQIGNGFGRFTERNRQDAGGQWIKRAGMTGLLCLEQPADFPDRRGRGHFKGFVETDPAVDSFAFFLSGHLRLVL